MRYNVEYAFRRCSAETPMSKDREFMAALVFWPCLVIFVLLILATVAMNILAFILLPFRI